MTINHFPAKILAGMDDSFLKKCEQIKKKFAPLSAEERYRLLMEMGSQLSSLPPEERTEDRIVPGCQSLLYLKATEVGKVLFFEVYADALISRGLAALLIAIYNGESPETILTRPLHLIEELELGSILSLNRSNGLSSIHLKMKQEAIKKIINKKQ